VIDKSTRRLFGETVAEELGMTVKALEPFLE
jgi:hypothetical protein